MTSCPEQQLNRAHLKVRRGAACSSVRFAGIGPPLLCRTRAEVGNSHQRCRRQQNPLCYPQVLNTTSLEKETLITSWVKTRCRSAAAVSERDLRLNRPRGAGTWGLPQRCAGEGVGRSLHSCCRSCEGLTQEPENWSIRGLSLSPMGCKWAPERIKSFSSWSCSSGTFHQKGANFTVLSK